MPEARLARTRGECRCPDGVCLYRSGNEPGYCRREVAKERLAIPAGSFQQRAWAWMLAAFGLEIAGRTNERAHRFLEESIELAQAVGVTSEEAHMLVDYVFNRASGEPEQEAGGVMLTLAGLCDWLGIDMAKAGETELARVWTRIDLIREKQLRKPSSSPLPGIPSGDY